MLPSVFTYTSTIVNKQSELLSLNHPLTCIQLLKAHCEEVTELLSRKAELCRPLKIVLEFAKSLEDDGELPQSLRALQSAVDGLEEERMEGETVRLDKDRESMVASGSGSSEDTTTEGKPAVSQARDKVGTVSSCDGSNALREEVEVGGAERQAVVNGESDFVEVDLGLYPDSPQLAHHDASMSLPADLSVANGDYQSRTWSLENLDFQQQSYPNASLAHGDVIDSCSNNAELSSSRGKPDEHRDIPDIAKVEMQVAFEQTDFDHPTFPSHEGGVDDLGVSSRWEGSQALTGEKEEGGRTEVVPSDARVRHQRSQSWSASLDDNMLSKGQLHHEVPLIPRELSTASVPRTRRLSSSERALNQNAEADEEAGLTHPVSLVAYPESAGIEIPKRDTLLSRRESNLSDFPDPYEHKSATSSLDSGSTLGSQSELNQLSASRRLGSIDTGRGFSRSNSLTGRSDVSDRISMALQQQSWRGEEDDVVAVPVKSVSGGG